MAPAYEEYHSEKTRDLLRDLRRESGRDTGCPVCGSGAWDHDDTFGYCQDCGFDLNSAVSFSYPEPITDPKHPDHHDALSDLWDNRDKFA